MQRPLHEGMQASRRATKEIRGRGSRRWRGGLSMDRSVLRKGGRIEVGAGGM